VAHLPSTTNGKSELEDARDIFRLKLSEYIFKGMKPMQIAKLHHPDNERKRKNLYARIRKMVRTDPEITRIVMARAQEEFLYAIGPIVDRLNQRAKATGKPDAVKLAFEASGFHNPRVKHEHSGGVEIKLTIPRPELPAGRNDDIDGEATELP